VRRRTSRLLLLLLLLLVASSLAACGGSSSTGTTTATTSAVTMPRKPPAASPAAPSGRAIGATQRIKAQGASLAVTVPRVFDPLRGSGAAGLPGTRVVGVLVSIHNRGPGDYDSSSTGDVTIVPSSGSAAAAYAPRGRCQTQLRDFDNQIASGETRTGCIAFTLDARARLVSVRFSANGGGEGVATWRG
jgi:hypothetical protein